VKITKRFYNKMRNNKHQSPPLVKDEVPTTSSKENENIFNGYFARTYTSKKQTVPYPKCKHLNQI
jgi:ribosomal protein S17E